jgi:myo-inositol-1(or 4)-monophosphatase
MDIQHIRRTAIGAAYKSGEILKSFLGGHFDVHKKGVKDLVTQADMQSEKVIVDTIKQAFPDHAILAEESGASQGDQRNQWVVDPLDGTINFAHHLPFFSISIAFVHDGKTLMGVVFNPLNGELFSALAGRGAELNDETIAVSTTRDIGDCLLATGFPYDVLTTFDFVTLRFERCLKHAQGIRRFGSAALDLCYVACGRFDGFWEQSLNPWDTAAGALIATEAGAVVTDFSNAPYTIDRRDILATNGSIHQEMVSLLDTKDVK